MDLRDYCLWKQANSIRSWHSTILQRYEIWNSCRHNIVARSFLFMPPHAAYAAIEALCFCLVPSSVRSCLYPRGFCRVSFIYFASQVEWISMKFAHYIRYHEQIKWLHFKWNWKRDKEARYNRIFESTSVIRDVKQVPTPSEWIRKFHYTDKDRCDRGHNLKLI